MKIKTKNVSYEYAMSVKKPEHKRPGKPNILFTSLVRALSIPDLLATRFTSVSYTHLDVYKRQDLCIAEHNFEICNSGFQNRLIIFRFIVFAVFRKVAVRKSNLNLCLLYTSHCFHL